MDDGPYTDIDHPGRRLHGSKFPFPDHSIRLGSQRRSYHDVVAASKHFDTAIRRKDLLNQRVDSSRRQNMPFNRQHFHSHGPHSSSHSSADVPVANDPHRVARNGQHVKSLPHASHLVPNHPPKILRKIQNGSEREFAQRWTEHPGPVGKHHRTFNQLWKQTSVESRRPAVYPTQPRAHPKYFAIYR